MNNKLKATWANLVCAKNLQHEIEPCLSRVEFDILCLASFAPITRAKIMRNKYFVHLGLSTIKRAVTVLISHGLIEVSLGTDGREKLLKVADL